jgi:PhnB protein
MKLHTYLNYGGNCEQAFRFYEQHLGGKITMMMTHGQQPNAKDVPPAWTNAILHARMNIGETELFAADVPPERFQPMRSAYLSLTVNSIEEAERIYNLLSDGGQHFHADAGDVFRLPFCHAQRQIRNVLDDPPRTPAAVSDHQTLCL